MVIGTAPGSWISMTLPSAASSSTPTRPSGLIVARPPRVGSSWVVVQVRPAIASASVRETKSKSPPPWARVTLRPRERVTVRPLGRVTVSREMKGAARPKRGSGREPGVGGGAVRPDRGGDAGAVARGGRGQAVRAGEGADLARSRGSLEAIAARPTQGALEGHLAARRGGRGGQRRGGERRVGDREQPAARVPGEGLLVAIAVGPRQHEPEVVVVGDPRAALRVFDAVEIAVLVEAGSGTVAVRADDLERRARSVTRDGGDEAIAVGQRHEPRPSSSWAMVSKMTPVSASKVCRWRPCASKR